MFLLESIAAVAAKIVSASTLAQVAAGVGITVAGVTGAGAAGVLPAGVQDGVAGAVEAVTPFDLSDSADDRVTGVDDTDQGGDADQGGAADQGGDADDAATPTGAETEDSRHDDADDHPGASPTDVPVVSTPAAPSTSHET